MKIPSGSICRYQWFELCFRIGKFLFATSHLYRQNSKDGDEEREEGYQWVNYDEVSLQKSFTVFVDKILKPFYSTIKK